MMALDRRKVTMRSAVFTADGRVVTVEAADYIAVEDIDFFVAKAWAEWDWVSVGTETDHGPGGPDGPYIRPQILRGA